MSEPAGVRIAGAYVGLLALVTTLVVATMIGTGMFGLWSLLPLIALDVMALARGANGLVRWARA